MVAHSWADHPKICAAAAPAPQLFPLFSAFIRVVLRIVFLTHLRPVSDAQSTKEVCDPLSSGNTYPLVAISVWGIYF